jgi:hypothetical protein
MEIKLVQQKEKERKGEIKRANGRQEERKRRW